MVVVTLLVVLVVGVLVVFVVAIVAAAVIVIIMEVVVVAVVLVDVKFCFDTRNRRVISSSCYRNEHTKLCFVPTCDPCSVSAWMLKQAVSYLIKCRFPPKYFLIIFFKYKDS